MSPGWASLAGCLALETVAGSTYAFSLYSGALKNRFSYTQSDVDLVASAENTAGLISLYCGAVYNACGSRCTCLLAMSFAVPAWLLMWSALSNAEQDSPLWHMLLYAFMQGNAAALCDLIAVVTASAHFPTRRGEAIGMVKSFVGISGAIYSCACEPLGDESCSEECPSPATTA